MFVILDIKPNFHFYIDPCGQPLPAPYPPLPPLFPLLPGGRPRPRLFLTVTLLPLPSASSLEAALVSGVPAILSSSLTASLTLGPLGVCPKFCGEFESGSPFRDPIPERRVIGGAVLTNTG